MRIWLAVQPADMRWSFDRLTELVRTVTGQGLVVGSALALTR